MNAEGCVNTCSCDHGYIRSSRWDEDTQKHVPVDYLCRLCPGVPCMACVADLPEFCGKVATGIEVR